MKAEIITLADQEHHTYRVSIFIDGVFRYCLPASMGTVVKVRNGQAERLAEIATEVTAGAIPTMY